MELPTASSSCLKLETSLEDLLDVRELSIDDGLNALFSVELEVVCENPALDFEALVGQPAAFRIDLDPARYPETPRRAWSGVVSEAHLLRSEGAGLSTYHLTLVPRLWLLTQRTNCRVFQQMSELAIAKQLLGEWDIPIVDRCSSTYKTRKYRVQYQESDFSFICRLLEDAGISYFFESDGDESQLVLSDAPERGAERSLPLDHTDSPDAGSVYATRMRASRAITSGAIAIADHDHRLPNQPLIAATKASLHAVEAKLERFVYQPGAFRHGTQGPNDTPVADDRGRTRTDMQEAQRRVSQLAAAAVARTRRAAFDTNALDLGPGMRVSVENHALSERQGKLLVTATTWSGTHDSDIHVAVRAVAASGPFRPEMATPRPVNQGIEMATVVGPEGEEIHCDEFGRVRIQFHWDRYGAMDEMSSCWVPVNQPWAGGSLGAVNIPRIGQEVMIGFLNGDPEEPMVVGRMYTNLQRPPYPLPAKKNINGFKSQESIGGTGKNELYFDDSKGEMLMFRHAGKNEKTETVGSRDEWIGESRSARIDKNRSSSIGGNDKKTVTGNEDEAIEGNQTHSVKGNKVGNVIGDLLSYVKKGRILDTLGSMVSNALTHSFDSRLMTTIKVGKSSIVISPESIVIETPQLLLNPGKEIAEKAALGLDTSPTPSPSSMPSTEELPS